MSITLGRRLGEELHITNVATGHKIIVTISHIGEHQIKVTCTDPGENFYILRGELTPSLRDHKIRLFKLAKGLKEEDN